MASSTAAGRQPRRDPSHRDRRTAWGCLDLGASLLPSPPRAALQVAGRPQQLQGRATHPSLFQQEGKPFPEPCPQRTSSSHWPPRANPAGAAEAHLSQSWGEGGSRGSPGPGGGRGCGGSEKRAESCSRGAQPDPSPVSGSARPSACREPGAPPGLAQGPSAPRGKAGWSTRVAPRPPQGLRLPQGSPMLIGQLRCLSTNRREVCTSSVAGPLKGQVFRRPTADSVTGELTCRRPL